MKIPSLDTFVNFDLQTPKKESNKSDNNLTKKATKKTEYKPKEVYLKWTSQDKQNISFNNKKLSRSMIIIAMFFGTLFIVMGEYFLILLIISIFFVYYALNKSPVQNIEHEINSNGLSYAGQQYDWDSLEKFFFKEGDILCIDTYLSLPRRLFMIIDVSKKEEIKNVLEKFIPFVIEPEKDTFNKVYDTINNSLIK